MLPLPILVESARSLSLYIFPHPSRNHETVPRGSQMEGKRRLGESFASLLTRDGRNPTGVTSPADSDQPIRLYMKVPSDRYSASGCRQSAEFAPGKLSMLRRRWSSLTGLTKVARIGILLH